MIRRYPEPGRYDIGDNMDLLTLFQQMAFPACCCIVLFKMLVDEKDAHKIESQSFIEAINNNTRAIERIVDLIEDSQSLKREDIFHE